MGEFVDVWLGAEALNYLVECLEGSGALGQELLKHHDFSRGRVRTRLPADTPRSELNQLTWGGKTRESREEGTFWGLGEPHRMLRVEDTLEELAREIHAALHADAGSCVFENQLARLGDPILASCLSRVVTLGARVYHLVCPGDDLRIVRAAVRESRSPTFLLGAISDYRSAHCEALASSILSTEELVESAKRARAVVASAYDGEAYLVWEPANA